ncbi:UNVERIFIED_CONTAM: hypothetical protein RMT77_008603 [Armadillidium vulgare]
MFFRLPRMSRKVSNIEQETNENMKLTINGKEYSLIPDLPADMSLLRFIRDHAMLKGTKALCHEGGCGACTVVATRRDAESNRLLTFSLRSCRALVYACVGWSIITIESLGNHRTGYDKLQVALNGFYGTQCGYCTPGFVMNMKGNTTSSRIMKIDQIENILDGNICRCTGYRPIMDAFKSFGSNAPLQLYSQLRDIEDSYSGDCSKSGQKCMKDCDKFLGSCEQMAFSLRKKSSLQRKEATWYYPNTIEDIYEVMNKRKYSSTRFVVGNTGQGLFKNDGPYDTYIDTSRVRVLSEVVLQPELVIGSNVSLNSCIEVFRYAARRFPKYEHLMEIAKHWEKVANHGIRNVASWAGNLMMKYDHHDFNSDIFLTLVGLDAQLEIGSSLGKITEIPIDQFLTFNMENKIILSMTIPKPEEDVTIRSYKVTPRSVNTLGIVSACFIFPINKRNRMRISSRPTIVFGGINSSFIHALATEKFLQGKLLINTDDTYRAIEILKKEIAPDSSPGEPSPEFRQCLSQCLLYKAIIGILGKSSSPFIRSGGEKLERPISRSKQAYDANEDTWPIGQPLPKLESQFQISGEAEYLDDIPVLPEELYGAFVQSKIGKGEIRSVDASACLKMDGVVDFISASDIPGLNSFYLHNDPVFANGDIKYNGQSIGLVVAKTREIAEEGAKIVKVTYKNVKKPILTIKEAKEAGKVFKTVSLLTGSSDPIAFGDVEEGFRTSVNVIEGEISFGSQAHFTMEPLAARVVPIEDTYEVWCTTQWPTVVQNTVASNLNLPASRIITTVRRIGGAYGGKITRPTLLASAAAVAAHKLRKPVRIVLDLQTQMTIVGWRDPYLSEFKVGFDEEGRLQAVSVDIIADSGHVGNEGSALLAAVSLPNVYYCPNWKIQPYYALTDTPANTWCRAPGHVQGTGTMETIMERVAHSVGKDPLMVRESNFFSVERPLFLNRRQEENLVKTKLLPLLKKQVDYENHKKEIKEFNQTNGWKKRGISVIPLCYGLDIPPFFSYNCQVVIYEHDGTVAIKHGGIEMGQGINTKVAQVAAKTLEIPLENIKVQATDSFAGANSSITGGSYGSDLNSHGVKICCEKLRERMKDIRDKMAAENESVTWKEIVKKCFQEQIDMSERIFTFPKLHPKGYDIWGVAFMEVELDVLTGQFLILRCDIIEDCGRSLNPYVDMGQVEGAFIMGIGFYTSEERKLDPNSGENLSNSTWHYKPPMTLDTPIDFRVTFLPKGDNEYGVVRSKASGEPPLCLSYAVVSALREAIKSKRADDGDAEWFDIDPPLTTEKIHRLCNVNPSNFKF